MADQEKGKPDKPMSAADRKKGTARRDEMGVRKQSYRRFQEGRDYEPTKAEQTIALCDMMRRGFLGVEDTPDGGKVQTRRTGRPRKYEKVEDFIDIATRYIDYIESKAREGARLIPDIEGFCCFAGISRDTLNDWERSRPGAYSDSIKDFKTAIAAYKKQLALAGEIPAIVFATDFNNNHGYTQQQKIEIDAPRKLESLPNKEDIVRRLPNKTDADDEPDIDL